MHGRPRKAPKPEEEEASTAKAVKLRSLQSHFISNHHHKMYDLLFPFSLPEFHYEISRIICLHLLGFLVSSYTQEAIELSTKLLEINPEAYTAWNYRKLAVEDKLSRIESDPNLVKSILDEELRVVSFPAN